MTSFSLGPSALIGKYLICKQYRQATSAPVDSAPGHQIQIMPCSCGAFSFRAWQVYMPLEPDIAI